MTVDIDKMRAIVERLYVADVERAHGDAGARALKALLLAVRQIYKHLDPESVATKIVVFRCVGPDVDLLDRTSALTVQRAQTLSIDVVGPVVVQVLDSGEFRVWNGTEVPVTQLAANAVVYEYRDRSEFIYAKNESHPVMNPCPGYASVFGLPTFSELRDALDAYRTRMARHSTCGILSEAWFDQERLFFKAKPEVLMRRSLTQFLQSTLRDAEVRPEQNVDETQPIDIKVTAVLSNRRALIEIKWLGVSKNSAGKITTKYTPSRAKAGAKQLADYLDDNKPGSPDLVTRGFLTVFDARRRALKPSTTTLSCKDARHHANDEIKYKPDHHSSRTDFEKPFRFFLDPECT